VLEDVSDVGRRTWKPGEENVEGISLELTVFHFVGVLTPKER